MTAPWSFQFPSSQPISPGPFQPGPTGGDQLQQGVGDLGKVLMALRQLSQQSQIENRQIDVHQQLGMGEIGAKRAENQRLIDEQTYKQTQETQKQSQTAMAGKGLRQMLSARGITGLENVPDGAMTSLVPDLEKAGILGPLTDAERRLTTFVGKYQGTPNEAIGKEFLGPPKPASTVVNVDTKGRTAYAEARGKGLAEGDIKAGDTANQNFTALASNFNAMNLVDKAYTGAGAQLKLDAARVLKALGRQPTNNLIENTQELIRYGQSGTVALLGTRALGSGTAVSDADRQYMRQVSGEDITRDPAALKKIFRINSGAEVMQIEETINQLRQRSQAYPEEAVSLNADAKTLENRLRPMLQRYTNMLIQEEHGSTQRVKDFIENVKALPYVNDLPWIDQYLKQTTRQQQKSDSLIDKALGR